MTPGIPLSYALSEATPDSIQELFSIDPEHYQDQNIDRVIDEMRKLREKLIAADAAGKPTRGIASARSAGLSTTNTSVNPDDLGI